MRKMFLVAFLLPLLCGAAIPVGPAVAAPYALVAPAAAPLLIEAQYYRPAPPRGRYQRRPPPRRYYGGRSYDRRYAAPAPRYRNPPPGYYRR